jgi:hypothetical protein
MRNNKSNSMLIVYELVTVYVVRTGFEPASPVPIRGVTTTLPDLWLAGGACLFLFVGGLQKTNVIHSQPP